MIGIPRHHAIAMAKPPVRFAPRGGVVRYLGIPRHHAVAMAKPPVRVLRQKRRIPRGIGRSGSELAAALNSRPAQLLQKLPGIGPVAQAAAQVIGLLAPVLDTSLQSFQCAPGNPNYPACLTPGGSAAALTQSIGNEKGVTPAIAAQIVREAVQQGGLGGGGAQGLGKARILKEN